MKKILIATKELNELGLHQVISTMDTNEYTTETKVYYNGKLYKKETYYHETQGTNNAEWEMKREYYTDKEYTIIII